ncbi:MAG: ATP-NAD kinase family protein [Candidatus Hermodarchaeota archaeon]|nr:ATP-NAD kinase family protein [Candidatus Hermodarchaeota archaeon]
MEGCSVTPSPDKSRRIGFLINPIAGMGGRVGLKGTDGVVEKAQQLGAQPVSPDRAVQFLRAFLRLHFNGSELEWVTCPEPMGARVLLEAGITPEVVPMELDTETQAEDTRRGIELFCEREVELIVFVGGDGTARDILDALGESKNVLVLGVPAGVKMYSGIFAVSPEAAAGVVIDWLKGETTAEPFEIMDANEEAIRSDQFAIELYGYLHGPLVPTRMPGAKFTSPTTVNERENQEAVARTIIEDMVEGDTYILGPGSTVRAVTKQLGIEKTLLGVDLYQKGKIHLDVNEQQLLELVPDFLQTWIIVSPIGNQGILFGRGNQQISPNIIRRIPPEQILVVATHSKIGSLAERGLHVDTGDSDIDKLLSGYIRVLVDYRTWRMVKITRNI